MILTFSKEPNGSVFENNQPHVAMSFESQTLPEIVLNFETFLRGCGFEFDGHLDFEEDEVSKEFALQRLSDISQEIEQTELQALIKSFFEDYLDVQEESDSGRVFNPIHVSCTRAMMIEPMAKLLMRMRELSGAKE